ncbi:hypothetical protein KKC13_07935 [bacterium]|nr:hypothetical protein [bacterium]MBU1959083.1 hypothetical protein [bacterium]
MSILSIATIDVDLTDASPYLSAAQIAQHFNIEATKINHILRDLKWIEKEYDIWWIATVLGKKNGAIEQTHANDKIKYVHWSKEILENEELNLAIQRYIHTYKNDRAYKNFIAKHYLDQGYTLWNHTEDKGLDDKNINYIAKKNREIILINCRGNPTDITIKEIKIFEQQKEAFILENPIFADYNVKLLYNMSGFFLTEEAFWYIQEHSRTISYQILK